MLYWGFENTVDEVKLWSCRSMIKLWHLATLYINYCVDKHQLLSNGSVIMNYTVRQAELGEPHSRFKLSWILFPLYFFVRKILGYKKFWVQLAFLIQKKFESQKFIGQKIFCVQNKLFPQKTFVSKNKPSFCSGSCDDNNNKTNLLSKTFDMF